MNKREKRLLFVTLGIVSVGATTWLLRDDGSAAAAPEPVVEATLPPGADPGSTVEIVPSTFIVRPEDLEALVYWRNQRDPLQTVEDPFIESTAILTDPDQPPSAVALQLPTVTAIYQGTSTDQGAIIDGEVRFKGEHHEGFQIVEVRPDGVRLTKEGHEYFAPYVPGSTTPSNDKPRE